MNGGRFSMALIGLVRVSTDKQNTQRQARHRRPARPVERAVLHPRRRPADRPRGRPARPHNLLEGLIVLNDLFQRGVGVKVLEGIAAGEHTERSFILALALALAEDRRRDIVHKTLKTAEGNPTDQPGLID